MYEASSMSQQTITLTTSTNNDSPSTPIVPPSLNSIIRPLVLINISDHITRELCANTTHQNTRFSSPENVLVIGALLGSIEGGKQQLTLSNSFELAFNDDDVTPSHLVVSEFENEEDINEDKKNNNKSCSLISVDAIDWLFLEQRKAQYSEVFDNIDIVGWYIGGMKAQPYYLTQLLLKSKSYCEAPLILVINKPMETTSSHAIQKKNNNYEQQQSYIMKNCCYPSFTIQNTMTNNNTLFNALKTQTHYDYSSKLIHLYEVVPFNNNNNNELLNDSFEIQEIIFTEITSYHLLDLGGEAERIAVEHVVLKGIVSPTIENKMPPQLDTPTEEILCNKGTTSLKPANSNNRDMIINTANTISSHLNMWNESAEQLKHRLERSLIFLQIALKHHEHIRATPKFEMCLRLLLSICHAIQRERQHNTLFSLEEEKKNTTISLLKNQLNYETLNSELSQYVATSLQCIHDIVQLNSSLQDYNTQLKEHDTKNNEDEENNNNNDPLKNLAWRS